MNPLLDQLLVTAAILGALGYFVIGFRRRRASGKACGSGCCAPSTEKLTRH